MSPCVVNEIGERGAVIGFFNTYQLPLIQGNVGRLWNATSAYFADAYGYSQLIECHWTMTCNTVYFKCTDDEDFLWHIARSFAEWVEAHKDETYVYGCRVYPTQAYKTVAVSIYKKKKL